MRFEIILLILTLGTGLVWLASHVFKLKANWLTRNCKDFFPILLIVFAFRTFLFEPFRIPSGSMRPTLLEGDFIVVNKFKYGLRLPVTGTVIIPVSKPKAGDIVVFRHTDGKDLIKRVVGVAGDHIKYENENLYVNGKLVDSKLHARGNDNGFFVEESIEQLNNQKYHVYRYPDARQRYTFTDVVVPENSYFVLGDNRNNSEDGRYWGFLSDKNLIGKAFGTWMSWDSDHADVRWSRIGKSIYE